MSLSNKDKKILSEIVAISGNCLESKRCSECPFRSVCLPEFLNPRPLTRPQRLNMALDVLSYNMLLDDNFTAQEIESYFVLDERSNEKSRTQET